MASLGLSLGAGPGSPAAGGGGGPAVPNPNLLRWTDGFDNAVWVKSAGTLVTANDASSGDPEADLVNFTNPFGTCAQVSQVVALAGAEVRLDIFDVSTSWTRYQITGTFDSTAYVFAVDLRQTEAGIGGRIRLDRTGGLLLRCGIEDIGDGGAVWARHAQLEIGSVATAYVARTT